MVSADKPNLLANDSIVSPSFTTYFSIESRAATVWIICGLVTVETSELLVISVWESKDTESSVKLVDAGIEVLLAIKAVTSVASCLSTLALSVPTIWFGAVIALPLVLACAWIGLL